MVLRRTGDELVSRPMMTQYSKPRMRRCHNLSPGSLHALGGFETLPCSRVFFTLIYIYNGLYGRYLTQTHMDETYKHDFMYVRSGTHRHFHWRLIAVLTQSPTVLIFVDITITPKLSRKYLETWLFVVVSEQWQLEKNIRGSSYSETYVCA